MKNILAIAFGLVLIGIIAYFSGFADFAKTMCILAVVLVVFYAGASPLLGEIIKKIRGF